MNQDAEHLRLLSIFHYIVGGLLAFFACIPIFHLVLGLLLVLKPQLFGPGNNHPPQFIGWIFVIFAGVFMVLGWTLALMMLWSGRCLSRRRHYSFCFVLACLGCLFMPFGTVLGVFTIIVLVRPAVKALFDQLVVPDH